MFLAQRIGFPLNSFSRGIVGRNMNMEKPQDKSRVKETFI